MSDEDVCCWLCYILRQRRTSAMRRIKRSLSRLAVSLLAITVLGLVRISVIAEVQFTGVNLAGAEFGASSLPGTFNVNYTYPNQTEVDYYID